MTHIPEGSGLVESEKRLSIDTMAMILEWCTAVRILREKG